MVSVEAVTDDDFIKHNELFKMADVLFGWSRSDSNKVLIDDKEYILFGYHPVFMLFSCTDKKLYNTFTLNDNNEVIAITIDDYQLNIGDNMVYVIKSDNKHESLQLSKNNESPDFEVSANGLVSYMQYDEKNKLRLLIRYDQCVVGDSDRIYFDYLKQPFYISIESNPVKRDKGLFFLGRKNAYYRLDFDVWNNKWQYDLSTIGEYGLGAVLASDTISLHNGQKEFSRYYKELLSIGDYFSLTGFPITKAYKEEDVELIIERLGFNKKIPDYLISLYNNRNKLINDYQSIVDALYSEKTKKM